MARKVFISVLGASFYEKSKYGKSETGFVSSETHFVQQATLEYLKTEKWGENDVAYILLTDKAKTENWDKTITKRKHHTRGEEDYIGLERVIEDMNLPFPTIPVPIKDGNNEDEMWNIFQQLYKNLQEGDQLYFDLTHSFRYIPMLVLVLGNYAKFLKHTIVCSITYGNYEVGRLREDKISPIIDLLPLTMLQDWTFAAADLIRNGNIQRLQELTKVNALPPMLRAKGKKNIERNIVEQPLSRYVEALQNMLTDMKLCLGPNILNGQSVNAINDQYKNVTNHYSDLVAPIRPIIDTIQNTFKSFKITTELDPEEIQNGYEAARWCYEHQLYQQAFTILDENITTQFCQMIGTDTTIFEERKASNAFLRHGDYQEDDWKSDKLNDNVRQKVQKNLREKKEIVSFIQAYQKMAKWIHEKRNTYNHASMANDTLSHADIEELGKKLTLFTEKK